ncbi:DNA translocase FtsK [Planococcus halocryophilus]|uniref:DNA translocase FtsK n=1 Tax=Planococcus halocryophilus TaxID=1215089 RepID=UPI001F0FEB47|nr:DNA translocase FtsK [Planococcus halocryophilus]MCH4826964.1 DNA translocase FtsK [Planococcus halocryophilus]
MSWIKNVWNRMFTDTDGVEEIDEEIIYEEAPTEKKEKAPFRFPLIPDEEKEDFFHDIKRPEPRTKMPIFDEQERDVHRKEVEKPLMGPKEAPTRSVAKTKRKTPELPNQNARRFEPSRSVSPVHGYNVSRPEPIQKKVEEQRESKLDREMYDEAIQEKARAGFHKPRTQVEPEIRSSYEKESIQSPKTEVKHESPATSVVSNTVSFVLEAREREEKALLLKEEALEEANELKESSPEIELVSVDEEVEVVAELEFEEQPEVEIELGVTEQQPELYNELDLEVQAESETLAEPTTEEIEEPQVSEVEVNMKPEVAPKREKTVPFNVLMLKSDKESLKNKAISLSVTTPSYEKPVAQVPEAEKKTANLVEQVEPDSDLLDSAEPKAYQLPLREYLLVPENDRKDEEWMEEQGERLVEALSHFQVKAEIVSTVQGPAVTQFELKVAQGIKVSKIRNLADDLKLALAARDIRIQAPIPGKSSIGIEIPNRTSRAVRISEIIGSAVFEESDSPLEAALGLDLTGKPVTLDLRKMPHGLIAGATGSGKSVCINSLLVSLLYKSSPRDLKLLLIDPKMVELAPYNHIPHLVSPVITDVKAATASLKWAVEEMERRYQLFAHSEVRDISRYNKRVKEKGHHAQHLPYILIVIDELADLMMMSPSDVEDSICRIAQKARACGIHLVIATQRPSVDVITGLIKSNIPTRIAFSVSSQVDSRTILDSQGAERLLGRGDMLYLGNGMSAPSRLQGTFVTDDEIEKVIEHVRSQGKPEYFFKEEELIKRSESPAEQDDLFEDACRFIMTQGSASTSLLQRKFHIGYNRAARLMDLIEQHGFISEQNGSKARTVLITENEIERVFS